MENNRAALWVGIAVGTAAGIGIVLSRRRRTRWEVARGIQRRVAERSGDLAECTRDIVDRVRVILDQGRKVVEDASDLYHHGRKVVGV
jgi:hypothetical protein